MYVLTIHFPHYTLDWPLHFFSLRSHNPFPSLHTRTLDWPLHFFSLCSHNPFPSLHTRLATPLLFSICTHNLFLSPWSAAVSHREGGGAHFSIPRELVVLAHRANGDGVGTNGVAITVAAVCISASIACSPHKDGAEPLPTLSGEALNSWVWFQGKYTCTTTLAVITVFQLCTLHPKIDKHIQNIQIQLGNSGHQHVVTIIIWNIGMSASIAHITATHHSTALSQGDKGYYMYIHVHVHCQQLKPTLS